MLRVQNVRAIFQLSPSLWSDQLEADAACCMAQDYRKGISRKGQPASLRRTWQGIMEVACWAPVSESGIQRLTLPQHTEVSGV